MKRAGCRDTRVPGRVTASCRYWVVVERVGEGGRRARRRFYFIEMLKLLRSVAVLPLLREALLGRRFYIYTDAFAVRGDFLPLLLFAPEVNFNPKTSGDDSQTGKTIHIHHIRFRLISMDSFHRPRRSPQLCIGSSPRICFEDSFEDLKRKIRILSRLMRFSEGCIKIRAELVPGFIAA